MRLLTSALARLYGLADRGEIRREDAPDPVVLAPATVCLRRPALARGGVKETFDFSFIAADKESYEASSERVLALTRPGGLILIDNVLWKGLVVDGSDQAEATIAIREFNAARRTDERVDLVMLPVADGLTLLRKR